MLHPPPQSLADLVQRFHTEHAARFAHSDEADVVEIATLRLAAIGRMPDPNLQTPPRMRRSRPPLHPAAAAYGWMTPGSRPQFISGTTLALGPA